MKCRKHGGINLIHIKTTDDRKGNEISECLTYSNSFTKVVLPSCNTYIRMPDDNSRIGQNCGEWGWDNVIGKAKWLMDHLMYIKYHAHWNLGFDGKRYECDTYEFNNIQNGDFWKIYVR